MKELNVGDEVIIKTTKGVRVGYVQSMVPRADRVQRFQIPRQIDDYRGGDLVGSIGGLKEAGDVDVVIRITEVMEHDDATA